MKRTSKTAKEMTSAHFVKRCLFCGGVMEPTKLWISEDTVSMYWKAAHNEPTERFRLHCCRTCGVAFHVKEQV